MANDMPVNRPVVLIGIPQYMLQILRLMPSMIGLKNNDAT